MKIFFLIIAAIIQLWGCSENDNPINGEENKTVMTAIVDGETWSANSAMVMVHENISHPYLSFQGYFEKNGHLYSQIIFLVGNSEVTAPITIEYPDTTNDVEYYAIYQIPSKADSGMYQSITGKLVITKYNGIGKNAEGTFEFTAKNIYGNLVKVTNGKFNMPIRKSATY